MNQCKRYALGVMVAIPMLYFGGCRGGLTIPFRFPLGTGLGSFEVSAGETSQNQGTGSLSGSSRSVGSASLSLDPDDISFTPADDTGGKGTTTFQTGGTFKVTAGIGAVGDVNTVCDTPVDEYGPYIVTLDANFNVTSISPSSINLEPSTLDLINEGEFSICLTVDDSTVSGTLNIEALSFSLGL